MYMFDDDGTNSVPIFARFIETRSVTIKRFIETLNFRARIYTMVHGTVVRVYLYLQYKYVCIYIYIYIYIYIFGF